MPAGNLPLVFAPVPATCRGPFTDFQNNCNPFPTNHFPAIRPNPTPGFLPLACYLCGTGILVCEVLNSEIVYGVSTTNRSKSQ